MSQFQYRVVPFMGRIQDNGNTDQVSEQVQSVMDVDARDGWEFHSLRNVNIEVKPGCLGALLGAKKSYVRHDQLIFRPTKVEAASPAGRRES